MGLFDPPKDVMQRIDPEGQPNERMRQEAQRALDSYRVNEMKKWAWILFGIAMGVLIWLSFAAAA